VTPGARLSAAIEILDEVAGRHRPAAEAAREWGRAHRFAGSSDRAAIASLVNAALRRRQSAAWIMGDDAPRALCLGALRLAWGLGPDDIAAIAGQGRYAPGALGEAEACALAVATDRLADAPFWVRGDIPEWLAPQLEAAFGDRAGEEGAGLAGRAPLDLRVNTLRTGRDQVARALEKYGARPTALSPIGLRIALAEGPARPPDVEAHALHGRGRFEVQDEGSQVAALMAGARPGMQVVDYCAGAGGKTLALAATMENRGQIHAHDSDARRLRPIFERLRRAGARNVQVLSGEEGLEALTARSDLVLVDAPCTGSGVWRRRPDAKWRLKPEALEERRREQARILASAAPLVRPGGRLVYVTCSVLPAENSEQVEGFVAEHSDFALIPWERVWSETLGTDPPASAADGDGLLLTPARHATDGFFIAVLGRG
jgi:16S rRNA (cytosine967-C5)-methyltransferase